MAEVDGPSSVLEENNSSFQDENDNTDEPKAKKTKLNEKKPQISTKLEERLNGILCCTVCLDLPAKAVYQCTNGHLACSGCLAHLLADARLKDETPTCPNCRCEISRSSCIRNLAVEKAISELPAECAHCSKQLPRCNLETHVKNECLERPVPCNYAILGCPWQGPYHEQDTHQRDCAHPKKTGLEIMSGLQARREEVNAEINIYKEILNVLSLEKIAFTDMQLKPYRTEDYITKLYYESGRYSAFNMLWVVRANVNDNQRNPSYSMRRELSYQVICKSKLQNALHIRYMLAKGPYSDTVVTPALYQHEFTADSLETPFQSLPLVDGTECNKQLAQRVISLRLIMFQLPK